MKMAGIALGIGGCIGIFIALLAWLEEATAIDPLDLLSVTSAVVLGTLALFGDKVRNSLFKPNLQPVESRRTVQKYGNATFIYHRLIVKNARRKSWFPNLSMSTRVFLTYKELPKGGSFIPIPLRWTHFNTVTRDIPPGEEVYVDIFGKQEGESRYLFSWAPETGPGGNELDYFNPTQGDIRLEFFDQNGKVGDIYLGFDTIGDRLVIRHD